MIVTVDTNEMQWLSYYRHVSEVYQKKLELDIVSLRPHHGLGGKGNFGFYNHRKCFLQSQEITLKQMNLKQTCPQTFTSFLQKSQQWNVWKLLLFCFCFFFFFSEKLEFREKHYVPMVTDTLIKLSKLGKTWLKTAIIEKSTKHWKKRLKNEALKNNSKTRKERTHCSCKEWQYLSQWHCTCKTYSLP